ncbi:putative polyprotein [Tanacetum coccineum]
MLKICKDNSLVLSPTKKKIAVSTIDFLGAVIGEGDHKVAKGLKDKLGLDKSPKPSDYELVRKIKEHGQNLPDLEIPPENAYIILEIDGCMEGWGGIVKWKKSKGDPRSSEKICAYASGKFSTTQSTIDAEINACINTLEKLKIYYLNKQEVTLRTNCQAFISFFTIKLTATNHQGLVGSSLQMRSQEQTMHKRNEAISSSDFLLSRGSSTFPQCLSEEYEDHLRRSHEDFQPLPRIFIKAIFTHEEPGALYRHCHLKAN